MSKMNGSEASEILLPIAVAALGVARAEHLHRDVSPEMDEIAAILERTGMYAQDIGSTGPELKMLRIEGLLQQAKAVMAMTADGGSEAVDIDLAYRQVMNLHGQAVRLLKLPPMLPKPGGLSNAETEQAIMDHDPFVRAVGLDAQILPDDADGDFEEVTDEDEQPGFGAAARPRLESLCHVEDALSRRKIAGFFGDANGAKVFGFDLDNSDLNDPVDTLDDAFAAMEGGPAASHAST